MPRSLFEHLSPRRKRFLNQTRKKWASETQWKGCRDFETALKFATIRHPFKSGPLLEPVTGSGNNVKLQHMQLLCLVYQFQVQFAITVGASARLPQFMRRSRDNWIRFAQWLSSSTGTKRQQWNKHMNEHDNHTTWHTTVLLQDIPTTTHCDYKKEKHE